MTATKMTARQTASYIKKLSKLNNYELACEWERTEEQLRAAGLDEVSTFTELRNMAREAYLSRTPEGQELLAYARANGTIS